VKTGVKKREHRHGNRRENRRENGRENCVKTVVTK